MYDYFLYSFKAMLDSRYPSNRVDHQYIVHVVVNNKDL